MTDKVHKIREEVARIQLYTQSEVLKQVLDYIDEVQKEPVSMWHDASEEPKPNMELICVGQYGNPLVLSSNSDSFKSRDISKWAYFNDLLNLSNVQRTVNIWKVEEFLIDNLKELPIGNGKFKIKAEFSMQELLEKFENYMKGEL